MAAWPSYALPTTSRSSCCSTAKRARPRSLGRACRIRECGSPARGHPPRERHPRVAWRGPLEHLRGVRGLDLDLVTRGDVITRDHLVVGLTRTHHRIDAGVLIDHHLEKRRSIEADEFLDHARHVGLLVEPDRELESVGERRLHEILGMQALVARGEAAL